jgi:hypothetical protein
MPFLVGLHRIARSQQRPTRLKAKAYSRIRSQPKGMDFLCFRKPQKRVRMKRHRTIGNRVKAAVKRFDNARKSALLFNRSFLSGFN